MANRRLGNSNATGSGMTSFGVSQFALIDAADETRVAAFAAFLARVFFAIRARHRGLFRRFGEFMAENRFAPASQ
jgi:hypothetical protein